MKAFRFYAVMPLAFLILLIEVPCRELCRAWRNLKIMNRYRDNIRLWVKEWRIGP
jgi:hypothetical protein